jgi:hypothetical protein
MLREEIIQGLYRGDSKAIKEAIKALEQEPVIDKIRAEIEKLQTYKMFIGEKTVYVERDDVLAIIDKYKEVRGNNADSN